MVSRRAAKSKGSQFEMDCAYSLKKVYSDIIRLGSEGFQMQFDLQSDAEEAVFECKRLKGLSWNQLVKLYDKLIDVTPTAQKRYILFQSNRQPCLVFYETSDDDCWEFKIKEFESVFGVPFEKHPSTRVKKK